MRLPFRSSNTVFPAAFRIPCLLAALAAPSAAQLAFMPNLPLAALQVPAPWDGPGAAIYNPAFITETRRMYAGASYFQTVSGKAGLTLIQGAAALPAGLKMGLTWFHNRKAIAGSNAVIMESILAPMAGWGTDKLGGSDFHLGFAFAIPIRRMNAFNAVKSTSSGLDAGINLIFPEFGGRMGRLHLALGSQNLLAGKVELPEDNPSLAEFKYEPFKPAYSASTLWSGLAGILELHLDQKLQTDTYVDGGSLGYGNTLGGAAELLTSYGAEVRPIPYFGMKLERTWLEYWTAGAHGYIPIEGFDLEITFDVTHDKLSKRDEGRGMLWAMGASLSY